MESGQNYDVLRPEFCMILTQMIVVSVPENPNDEFPEDAYFLPLSHVSLLKDLSVGTVN